MLGLARPRLVGHVVNEKQGNVEQGICPVSCGLSVDNRLRKTEKTSRSSRLAVFNPGVPEVSMQFAIVGKSRTAPGASSPVELIS